MIFSRQSLVLLVFGMIAATAGLTALFLQPPAVRAALHLFSLFVTLGLVVWLWNQLHGATRRRAETQEQQQRLRDELEKERVEHLTVLREYEQAVRQHKETESELIKARAALDDASDAIIILNPDGSVQFVNMAFGLRFQVTNQDRDGFHWRSIFAEEMAAQEAFITASTGQPVKDEFQLKPMGEEPFPARISLTLVDDDDFEPLGILMIITDITEQKKLEKRLKELAMLDGLTGLYNRRSFDERLEQEWKRCLRSSLSIAVIMMDIDHFKAYNDTYGHQQGDTCLRSVAQAIRDVPGRPFDFVARYGGEEFVCLLPETDLEGARIIAEQMRSAVTNLTLQHRSSRTADIVTISLGCAALLPAEGAQFDQFVQTADEALYASKEAGRNCVTASSQFA